MTPEGDEGALAVSVEMASFGCASMRPGRPSEAAQCLSAQVSMPTGPAWLRTGLPCAAWSHQRRGVHASTQLEAALAGAVDTGQLAVDGVAGAAWKLLLDVYILDADGALLDACLLAAAAVLQCLRLPPAQVIAGSNEVPALPPLLPALAALHWCRSPAARPWQIAAVSIPAGWCICRWCMRMRTCSMARPCREGGACARLPCRCRPPLRCTAGGSCRTRPPRRRSWRAPSCRSPRVLAAASWVRAAGCPRVLPVPGWRRLPGERGECAKVQGCTRREGWLPPALSSCGGAWRRPGPGGGRSAPCWRRRARSRGPSRPEAGVVAPPRKGTMHVELRKRATRQPHSVEACWVGCNCYLVRYRSSAPSGWNRCGAAVCCVLLVYMDRSRVHVTRTGS